MPHFLWPEPLSPAQLKRLEEHKYSASGRSLFEPPCQVFWNWLIQQTPTWIAPNTLTIVGLLVNIVSTVVLVYYCPTATEEVSKQAPLAEVSTRRVCANCIPCCGMVGTRGSSSEIVQVKVRRSAVQSTLGKQHRCGIFSKTGSSCSFFGSHTNHQTCNLIVVFASTAFVLVVDYVKTKLLPL